MFHFQKKLTGVGPKHSNIHHNSTKVEEVNNADVDRFVICAVLQSGKKNSQNSEGYNASDEAECSICNIELCH